ncbi:MAG: hypothetical protein JWQ04_2332 [Pedosphaera sp.]|nr:hypothetical protein [Pedosphaera sp.]
MKSVIAAAAFGVHTGAITPVGTNVILNWNGSFTLQSATSLNGTNSGFTDVPGPVLTGPYTNAASNTAQFFRLRN